ncbi:MAG: hypothetical protein V3V20_10285 [Algisphaera sp.]
MFKFFRIYNKIILVVGGVVLMLAFLVPQAAQMFVPSGANAKAGSVNGQTLRQGDIQQAAIEIKLLESLPLGVGLVTTDEVAWALLQHDAESMGLWASNSEVNAAIGRLGYDEAKLDDLARRTGNTPDSLRHVVRRFLIAEDYRRLVDGVAYTDPGALSASPALRRVELIHSALQQVNGNVDMYRRFLAPSVAMRSQGSYRLNTPLLRSTVRDNASSLAGRLVVLRPDPNSVPAPTEERLTEVFNTYRDKLPGNDGDDAYPFGYRYPNRVQGQYLSVSSQSIREAVKVPYLDIKAYYNAHLDEFADENGITPERPDTTARQSIKDALTQEKAATLGNRIAATLSGLVAEAIRGLPETRGYYELPAEFTSPSLEAMAAAVFEQFGVKATVSGDPQQWTAINELSAAPGIGPAAVDSTGRITFAVYAGQVRELAEDPDAVSRSLRTQVGLPGKPLRDFEGGVYLHLLVGAQKSHPPATLDQVRERVTADARSITAFETLAQQTDVLREAAASQSIDAVANQNNATAIDLPPFQRVAGIDGTPPVLPEIGTSEAFAAAAFNIVETLDVGVDLNTLPANTRTVVMALKDAAGAPGVAVFTAQNYEPLTEDAYANELTGFASVGVSLLLREIQDNSVVSAEALAQRTGFNLADYRGDDGDE